MIQTVRQIVAFLNNAKILVAFIEAIEYFGQRLEYYYPENPLTGEK